jgi:hypothetical protein
VQPEGTYELLADCLRYTWTVSRRWATLDGSPQASESTGSSGLRSLWRTVYPTWRPVTISSADRCDDGTAHLLFPRQAIGCAASGCGGCTLCGAVWVCIYAVVVVLMIIVMMTRRDTYDVDVAELIGQVFVIAS